MRPKAAMSHVHSAMHCIERCRCFAYHIPWSLFVMHIISTSYCLKCIPIMCVCAVVVLFFYSLHCLLPCFIFAWIPGYSVWHSSFSSSSNSDYSVCVCGCGLLQSETFNIPHQSLMRCKAVCCCCTQLWWRRRLVARSCRCFFFF